MELIKIYNGSTVSARELYKFFGVTERFSRWFERMKSYGFKEGKDFTSVPFSTLVNNNAKKALDDYALTLSAAKEISMLQRSEKGKEAREYFIKCEETLQELKQNKRFEAFLKLETTKDKLHQNVVKLGGDEENYIQIDTAGRKVFFNGQLIADEELSTLALKGRDFATELTNDILGKGDHQLEDVEGINKEQHSTIRKVIIENTKRKPEELPREDKIKKLGE